MDKITRTIIITMIITIIIWAISFFLIIVTMEITSYYKQKEVCEKNNGYFDNKRDCYLENSEGELFPCKIKELGGKMRLVCD